MAVSGGPGREPGVRGWCGVRTWPWRNLAAYHYLESEISKPPPGVVWSVMPHDPFYTSATWLAARRDALHRADRRCQQPGCGARASVVDHIRPRRAGGAPFDPANLRALCWRHHSTKTAARDGGFGNARSAEAAPILAVDASGVPLDPAHPWRVAATARGAGSDTLQGGINRIGYVSGAETRTAAQAAGVPGCADAGGGTQAISTG